jgi:predicted dinucleotide-binding enzyme
MKIGIIGAGNIGITAAKLFAEAGHQVYLSNSRGPETLAQKVKDLGPNVTATSAEDAAKFGEVVLEAIPFGRFKELPAEALSGKVVISASNYFPERDGEIDLGGLTQTELVAQHLHGSRVVKAFNTIYWEHLRDHGDCRRPLSERRTILLAGDDPEAKALVTRLIEEIGFTAVDMGKLAGSSRQETSLHGRPQRL